MEQNLKRNDKDVTLASIGLADRARRRDFFALSAILLFIFVILLFSGALGLAEVITALVIYLFAAIAFYLSTETESRRPVPDVPVQGARWDGHSLASGSELAFEGRPEDVRAVIQAYPQPALLASFTGEVFAGNVAAIDVFRLPRRGRDATPGVIRRVEVLKTLEALEKGETPEPCEIEIAGTPDQVFRVWATPITVQGEARALIVLIELTELRRAEKARADFLANASHELRTPLTSLAGFIETMRGPAKDDPEAWDRFLEIMYGQTERMRRLIHDLLSLSRIELSEHRRPDQIVDFSLVVEECFEALLPVARDKGITLELINSTQGAAMLGVRDELMQVAQNLIDNAVKYTSDNSRVLVEVSDQMNVDEARVFTARRWPDAARISLLQNRHDDNARFIALRVSDEGAGINRMHLPRLGERFYRVDEARGRAIGGTGLGLAIVKHIVAHHRGGMSVESQEGRGSAFGVMFPLMSSAEIASRQNGVNQPEQDQDRAL